jgi:hypothetical protein
MYYKDKFTFTHVKYRPNICLPLPPYAVEKKLWPIPNRRAT